MVNYKEILTQYNSIKGLAINQCTDNDQKEELIKLFDYVDNETEFLTSPASTRYHMSEKHGLLFHSVSVAKILLKLKRVLSPDISDTSCILVGLYHDLGKHNQYTMKEATPKQIQYGYPGSIVYRDDIVNMSHAHRSLYIISKLYKLSEEEAQAILYHDGFLLAGNDIVAHRECDLTILLHYADYWSCRHE